MRLSKRKLRPSPSLSTPVLAHPAAPRRECVVVTGGAGFIGSALVRQLVTEHALSVVTIDKLTYAGSLDTLDDVLDHPRHRFERADITDRAAVRAIFQDAQPSAVVHLAAQTHVDRSIDDPMEFIHTNVHGTFTLLEESLRYWRALSPERASAFRFLHVSTDEVFGALDDSGSFNEQSPYAPRSPYSASKAAADHLVRAWFHTYRLPVIVTSSSNNLGPYQFPDKFVPVVTLRALAGEPVPLYGSGDQVRDWLHVDDHARALLAALRRGVPGESYNIGARAERTNRVLAERICEILDEVSPNASIGDRRRLITLVPDRPGHDRRYAVDPRKAERDLAWRPEETLDSALRKTVAWYVDHTDWCERMQARYDGRRLGLRRFA